MRTLSFKKQLFFSLLLIAILPLCLMGLLQARLVALRLQKEEQQALSRQAAQAEAVLLQYFEQLDLTLQRIGRNPYVISALRNPARARQDKLYEVLYGQNMVQQQQARFQLYTKAGRCFYATDTTEPSPALPLHKGILLAAEGKNQMLLQRNEAGSRSQVRLYAALAVKDHIGLQVGTLVSPVQQKHLAAVLQGIERERTTLLLVDADHQSIYQQGEGQGEAFLQSLREQGQQALLREEKKAGRQFVVRPIGESGLYCIAHSEDGNTRQVQRSLTLVFLGVAGLSLLLSLLAAGRLRDVLMMPIDRLGCAMGRVQDGDLTVRLQDNRTDELGQISAEFNDMVSRLAGYVADRELRQRELARAQIAMMQAQLNPHFLYNTLDTIKWVSKANGAEQAAVMAEELAQILRTAISKAQLVPLSEELALIESYIKIQNIRLGGGLTLILPKADEWTDCIVPKLLLQPLVENAVLHGFADGQGGQIVIEVQEAEDELCIRVIDNGCGISEQAIGALRSRHKKARSGHLGLAYVDAILRLRYGARFGLTAERGSGGGTVITVRLPRCKEGEDVSGTGD